MTEVTNKTFQNTTVVFDGGAFYRDCAFVWCKMIIRPNALYEGEIFCCDECSFDNCTWHLDVTVTTVERWKELQSCLMMTLPGLVTGKVRKVAEYDGRKGP